MTVRVTVEWCVVFFFNDTATTEIYTLSLHDALPILLRWVSPRTMKETFVPPTDYRYPYLG